MIESQASILVLLSSYNGERYISQQIESILNQQDVNVSILIRDDGSTDSTVKIIESYSDNNIRLIKGKNIGAAQSFMELIFSADKYDFYAFSDQDDIWDPDKLKISLSAIEKFNYKPALYHSLAGRVDVNLNELSNKTLPININISRALLTSATGCTIVFNNPLMQILKLHKPNQISMHDAWVYRLAYSINANVIYDPKSHIKYRQHDRNVSGGNMTLREKFKRSFYKNAGFKSMMANELINNYKDIIPLDNLKEIVLLAEYKKNIFYKLRIIFTKKYHLGILKTDIINKCLFIFNRI